MQVAGEEPQIKVKRWRDVLWQFELERYLAAQTSGNL
jgi:hypothetical protein